MSVMMVPRYYCVVYNNSLKIYWTTKKRCLRQHHHCCIVWSPFLWRRRHPAVSQSEKNLIHGAMMVHWNNCSLECHTKGLKSHYRRRKSSTYVQDWNPHGYRSIHQLCCAVRIPRHNFQLQFFLSRLNFVTPTQNKDEGLHLYQPLLPLLSTDYMTCLQHNFQEHLLDIMLTQNVVVKTLTLADWMGFVSNISIRREAAASVFMLPFLFAIFFWKLDLTAGGKYLITNEYPFFPSFSPLHCLRAGHMLRILSGTYGQPNRVKMAEPGRIGVRVNGQ